MSQTGAPAEVAVQIIEALPLAVVRMPHATAIEHCTEVATPWPGVRIETVCWAGRTVDLEILRTPAGSHELTVFGIVDGRRTVLLHRAGLDLVELGLVLTADLTCAAAKRAAVHG
jgi:hypothetical protein